MGNFFSCLRTRNNERVGASVESSNISFSQNQENVVVSNYKHIDIEERLLGFNQDSSVSVVIESQFLFQTPSNTPSNQIRGPIIFSNSAPLIKFTQ